MERLIPPLYTKLNRMDTGNTCLNAKVFSIYAKLTSIDAKKYRIEQLNFPLNAKLSLMNVGNSPLVRASRPYSPQLLGSLKNKI